MSYQQKLVINQSQRLVLTPQLRQRIEMLQMTKLELGELVSQQLAENPVLEELAPDEVAVSPDLANIDFTETSGGALNGSAEMPENPLNSAEPFDSADQAYSANYSSIEAGEAGQAGETGGGSEFDAGYDASLLPTEFAQTSGAS